ncbi:MAG: hypothetical protein JNL82_40995, partial [Myxococcales bacterium]|nr:hypothetical protein [Myxococcales bacterium]
MADHAAATIRRARDRLIAAGLAPAAADRRIVQFLALVQHAGAAVAASPAAFAAAREHLSSGPGRDDRSLLAAEPEEPALPAGEWTSLVDLLAPAIPDGPEALGAAREALLGDARKRSGSFYTRPALARAVARRTLAPWLDGPDEPPVPDPTSRARDDPRRRADAPPAAGSAAQLPGVCDPAMGCGSLLLAAFAELAARWGPAALAGLHGVDADPLAVDLARWNLWRAAGAPRADLGLAARLVCGDSLIGAGPGDHDPPAPKAGHHRSGAGGVPRGRPRADGSPVPRVRHTHAPPGPPERDRAAAPVPRDTHGH